MTRTAQTLPPLDMIRIVLFDVVGTLLHPAPPVGDAYFLAGRDAGSRLTLDQVVERFRREFALQFGGDRAASQTSDELERQRWRNVIETVFDDVPDIDAHLFPRLWRHFGDSGNWRLFADVPDAWQTLADAGYELGLASNFDSRLAEVCRGFPLVAGCDRVFASSTLGWAKPASGFYRAIERELDCSPDEILLVGDDFDNDYRGAKGVGWHAVWLCREASRAISACPATDTIRSLAELPRRLGIDG